MDPGTYPEVRSRVSLAVKNYKSHTNLIEAFIKRHGHVIRGWETWDVAPFHVLNARKGEPVPKEILHALDSAIKGRFDVADQFTEANINPKVFMDASDISHRVFAEKLRTLRRVWFPNVPEPTSHPPANAITFGSNQNLTIVKTSTDEEDPTKVGIFSAVAGGPSSSDFYKISFDAPVKMSIVSGSSTRNFEVGLGHVKLNPLTASPQLRPPSGPRSLIPSLQHTAKQVAARVSAHMRGEYREAARIARGASIVQKAPKKVEPKKPTTNSGVTRRSGHMILRSMARSARQRASQPGTIEISDDDDDDDDDVAGDAESGDRTLPAEPSEQTRANPFGARQDISRDTPLTAPANSGLTAAPIPAFAENRTRWIVDVSSFGDFTFYNSTGKSPVTYIEDDEAKKKLRELIIQLQPVVVNVKYSGKTYQLSPLAMRILATYEGDSIIAIVPQLVCTS